MNIYYVVAVATKPLATVNYAADGDDKEYNVDDDDDSDDGSDDGSDDDFAASDSDDSEVKRGRKKAESKSGRGRGRVQTQKTNHNKPVVGSKRETFCCYVAGH